MPNKMLIDATHSEETRVVVLRGNRVEEFDFESANRKQLRGNIYLAKVTRVEPSLQAAFVDYGGNRHGFLAFGEIHPDYYQIPVADRQALIDEEERAARAADAEADHRAGRRAQRGRGAQRPNESIRSGPIESPDQAGEMAEASEAPTADAGATEASSSQDAIRVADQHDEATVRDAAPATPGPSATFTDDLTGPVTVETPMEFGRLATSAAAESMPQSGNGHGGEDTYAGETAAVTAQDAASESNDNEPATDGGNVTEVNGNGPSGEEEVIESVGGADAMEEMPERTTRLRRQYKIQEVIKRRQVMLVQVVKEERGTKGAALTTYLSLAGRYSVLMPNTARGGGISRKITDAQDRRRLKDLAQELEVPEGMGVILRTAGASRTKTEIKRDFEYLLRLWETVRDLTLKSTAPTLVYEEGSLVKRSIRDLYNKDIDEVLVAGDEGYKDAKSFMRMLMPDHARTVKPYHDTLPIFTRFGIESQLDAMFQPVVQLRSGGYIVLNQTEALVAIDVNSGRATREHHIEDTALKTNIEAAEEIARQLRLRDLAGLIVIDFIDMDEKRNNRTVERRVKEALKHDRARIQVGHISHFGLLEMSRQRIRSSVLESSTENCPHCGGSGHLRSVSSVALQLLRALEETLLKGATHNIIVRTRTEVALYLLNQKRAHLREVEERFQITVTVNADASIGAQVSYTIEKGELVHSLEQAKAIAALVPSAPTIVPDDEDSDDEEYIEDEDGETPVSPEAADTQDEAFDSASYDSSARDESSSATSPREGGPPEGEAGERKRRRRRRGRRGEPREHRDEANFTGDQPTPIAGPQAPMDDESEPAADPAGAAPDSGDAGADDTGATDTGANGEVHADGEPRRRRRGRRGGRRNRKDQDGEALPPQQDGLSAPTDATDSYAHSKDLQPFPEPAIETRDAPTSERHVPIRVQEPERAPVAPPTPAQPAPREPEAPRRKSTVREPAPMVFAGEPSAPAPVIPVPEPQPMATRADESNESDRPRRSGWWSKRVLGNG